MKISKIALITSAALVAITLALSGCDRTQSSSKTTTTTTTQRSPEGDSRTTKTTERKTEVDPK